MADAAGGRKTRRAAERRGRLAETVAACWLRLKGYRLVARRVRTPVGEIDLVLRRGRTIVFAEVKRRRDLAMGMAALTPTQRRRIGRAAEWWVMQRPSLAGRTLRFDLIVVSRAGWPRHISNAWMVEH